MYREYRIRFNSGWGRNVTSGKTNGGNGTGIGINPYV
jgi:hypothetical protein